MPNSEDLADFLAGLELRLLVALELPLLVVLVQNFVMTLDLMYMMNRGLLNES